MPPLRCFKRTVEMFGALRCAELAAARVKDAVLRLEAASGRWFLLLGWVGPRDVSCWRLGRDLRGVLGGKVREGLELGAASAI